MIYLALDLGLAQVGVAVSYEGQLAEPLTTFAAHQLLDHVGGLISQYHPDVIVIGEPHSGPVKDLALVLQAEIKRIFPGSVVLHPEDLTSKEAVKKMIEGGKPKEKRRLTEHATAAALILTDYLESHPKPE